MTYAGRRFDFQDYAQGQKGGLMNQPYTAYISGLVVTPGTVTATACPLNITAGSVRLDGELCVLAANITGLALITGTGFDGATPQSFDLFLRPRRIVPAATTNPGAPQAGDIYLNVLDMPEYQLLNEARVYGTAWSTYDLIKAPIGYGHNNMPLNGINPVIHSATSNNLSFFLSPEKDVYIPSRNPNFLQSDGQAYFRRSASIPVARITVANSAATVVSYLSPNEASLI